MGEDIQFRNRLRVARVERNLTQEELARLVGVTRQTISAIENGQYCPSAKLALLLAKRLDYPFEKLFYLEGESDEFSKPAGKR